MSETNLGNQINELLGVALSALFQQGKNVQLTYSVYDDAIKKIQKEGMEKYNLTYPIGLNSDKTPLLGDTVFQKDELIQQYVYLANNQLAINGIYQLVIMIEAVLSDLLRKVILKYPQKIGNKRSIKSSLVLSVASIEELHIKTMDSIINEISYKSPKEYSEACVELLSINFLECPAFHKYVEVKATRDIFIHNLGIINDLYVSKSGSHARGKVGEQLSVTIQYFLEAYEECIKFVEWLEAESHEKWHSSIYEERQKNKQTEHSAAEGTATEEPAPVIE